MIEWFKDGKTLPRRYVWEIILGAYNQFTKEESLVEVSIEDGVTCDVIGDVHGTEESWIFNFKTFQFTFLFFSSGQYYDYLHLLSLTGHPSEKHCLLMNGDLVDRGSWSIEVILTAFAFKCKFMDSKFKLITIFRVKLTTLSYILIAHNKIHLSDFMIT